MTVRVFVTVGTDYHRFDRLIGWIDEWAARNPEAEVLVQRGTSTAPRHAESVAMMGYDEVVAAMAHAGVVVAQGGPGGIMDARRMGVRPIVVPRLAAFDEVVDDHQVTFCRWMAERGMVTLAEDRDELWRLLDEVRAAPDAYRIPADAGAPEETIRAFAAVVDPLLAQRRGRRRRGRR